MRFAGDLLSSRPTKSLHSGVITFHGSSYDTASSHIIVSSCFLFKFLKGRFPLILWVGVAGGESTEGKPRRRDSTYRLKDRKERDG